MELFPFRPHPLVPGGHLQTIVGYYLSSPKNVERTYRHRVPVSDGDELVICENRPDSKSEPRAVILFMHGLGGEARSPYMLRLAKLFQEQSWIAFRMNHRGAGEGRGLARNIYHSGRSDDVSQVLMKIAELYPNLPLIAVGFSLSGNALLKLLGENQFPVASNLKGAIAVTPPIELSRCADALCQTRNRIYDLRFMIMLRQAIEERKQDFPGFPDFKISLFANIREFDELVTAPLNNFKSAEDYYSKCSAKQFLAQISVPTFLLASDDDPFVPNQTFENLPKNKFLRVEITRGGGHVGYVSAYKTPLGNRRWMDYAILTYSQWRIEARDSSLVYH